MRISEERQAARLRVAKIQLLLADAIIKGYEDYPELTEAEIVLALTDQLKYYANVAFIAETPIKVDE